MLTKTRVSKMCEIMRNIKEVQSVKVAEIYTHTHTHTFKLCQAQYKRD